MKDSYGIVDLPYDVNYILDILWRVGYDASTVDANAMWAYLVETDWTDFVLDRTALDSFWADNGIDTGYFDTYTYEDILLNELYVPDLVYDVHYILGLLG